MELITALTIVILGAILLGLSTKEQKTNEIFNNIKQKLIKKSFKQIVENTFPKYVILERNNQILICEMSIRNDPEELVFIRLNKPRKRIQRKEKFLIADYVNEPSPAEMKRDFGRFL